MKLRKLLTALAGAALIIGFTGCNNSFTLAEKLLPAEKVLPSDGSGGVTPKANYDMKIELKFSQPYSSKTEHTFYACYSSTDSYAKPAALTMSLYDDPACTTTSTWTLEHLANYYYKLTTSEGHYIEFYTNGWKGGYDYHIHYFESLKVNGTTLSIEQDQ